MFESIPNQRELEKLKLSNIFSSGGSMVIGANRYEPTKKEIRDRQELYRNEISSQLNEKSELRNKAKAERSYYRNIFEQEQEAANQKRRQDREKDLLRKKEYHDVLDQ